MAKHLIVLVFLISSSFVAHKIIPLLNIKVLYNSGFIFGLFENVSQYLKIVTVSVLFGILALIASFFYAFLSEKLTRLKWGITVFMGGIFGNILEKLYYGHAWDYLSFYPTEGGVYFNLNDLYQTLGLIFIVHEIFHKQDIIWFPGESYKRKKLILYRDVQVPITSKVLGLIFLGSLTQGILAVALLFPKLDAAHKDVEVIFLLSLVILNVILLPILGVFLLKELLRCLGPIYALERHFTNEENFHKPIKFRKTDYFGTLEGLFNNFLAIVTKDRREAEPPPFEAKEKSP